MIANWFRLRRPSKVPSASLRAHLRVESLDERALPAPLSLGVAVRPIAPIAIIRPGPTEGQRIMVTGILRTGIVAIGGETTGTILETSNGRVYELQLGRYNPREAARLNGKQVTVTGMLMIKPGVEIPARTIIQVQSLTLAFAPVPKRFGR